MAIKVLELHHHGIRVGPDAESVERARTFYSDVLGLSPDPGRPHIPTIDGYWMDVGGQAQIHLMGVNGTSKFAETPERDPSQFHVALAVADIQETIRELERLKVEFWVTRGVVGPESQQVFMKDPAGNMIELHQAGTCRCKATSRPAAAAGSGMR